MYLICALILLDWLYVAWLKYQSFCFKIATALFPHSFYGHEQIWLPPETWVELLAWMPPEQLENCQLANARLRDIVDRHRERLPRQIRQIDHRAVSNASILSVHIDTILMHLLLMLVTFFDAGTGIKFMLVLYSISALGCINVINHYGDNLQQMPRFVALVDKVWPRHSKLIVRICERKRMDRIYDWIFTNHSDRFHTFIAVLNQTTIIAMSLIRYFNGS